MCWHRANEVTQLLRKNTDMETNSEHPETPAKEQAPERLPAATCSQDRFRDWTVEDYEKEIRRVEASRRHLESVIPKLKRIIRRNELRAFDPSI